MIKVKESQRLFLTRIDFPQSEYELLNDLKFGSALGLWCLSSKTLVDPDLLERSKVFPYKEMVGPVADLNHSAVNKVFDRLMPLLAKELNRCHGRDFTDRFWLVTVGYWFRQYLDTFYDRYQTLRRVRRVGDDFHVTTIDETSEWVANDTDEYSVGLFSDLLNHQLFSQIVNRMDGFISIDSVQSQDVRTDKQGRKNNFPILRKVFFYLSTIFVRFNRIIMTRTYFSLSLQFRLALRFFSLPLLGTPKIDCDKMEVDRKRRSEFVIQNIDDPSEFEALVAELCGKNIPKIFIEGFEKLLSISERTRPKFARAYMTSNAFAAQEVYKMWLAISGDANGAKHIIIQHGGNYGHSKIHAEERYELESSDYYMTSGWTVKGNDKAIPLVASPRLGGIGRFDENPPRFSNKGNILWVLASLPRYQYTQWSAPQGPEFLGYLNDQKSFISHSSKVVRDNLLCRPYNYNYGWDDLNYIDPKNSQFSVDIKRKPLRKMIEKSKVTIFTYDSTSMMESMALNIPTICYWVPESWSWRDSAGEVLLAMSESSIFHSSGAKAAEHLNILLASNNLKDWWFSEKVQLARLKYCEEYALTSDCEYQKWSNFMVNLS